MTKLTYDMASFYNLKTEEAFQKLQSGITGEMEPLKRLGILVNETTTKSWALKNGIIKEGQALTETQKVRARYNVILEQTNKAQGDMERTLGSTTNVFRAIKDQVKLLSIEYGKILLPAGTKVANKMKEFLVENREEIIRFAGKAYSGMVLVKDIFKAYINFMKDDWKEGFRKSLDSTVVLFKAWGQSLKVVFEKIFTDIGANITTWLYNARQWKAARKFLIKNILEEEGGRQTIWGGTMYGVGEKYATKEEAARATDRIGKEADRILSIYGPEGSGFEQKKSIETTPWGKVGEQIAAINRGALEQIKDIMPEFAKGVEKAFAEHEKRLQDLKRPASAPSGEPPAPGVPTPDEGEPKTAFGRLAQQLQAREARLLTAAPGAKYDYARQTAKNTTEHLKLANQQTKQQSKLVELSQKAHELFSSIGWFQPAPEKAASQTAPEKVASQPATEKAANITVSTQAGQSNYAGSGNVELYTKGTLQNTGLAVKLLEKMTKILDKMELRQGRGGPGLRPANLS